MSARSFATEPWNALGDGAAGVRAGVWVVAVVAVLDAVGAVVGFTVQRTGDSDAVIQLATGGTVVEGSLFLLSLALGTAIPTLLLWTLFASSAHVIAGRIDPSGDGSFRSLAGTLGWSFLPLAVSSVLDIAGIFVLSPAPPATPSDNPAAVHALDQTLPMRLIDGAQILLLCWVALLVVRAVAECRDLSRRRAALASVVALLFVALGVATRLLNPAPVVLG